jgi:CheY-like chemotaxis protein
MMVHSSRTVHFGSLHCENVVLTHRSRHLHVLADPDPRLHPSSSLSRGATGPQTLVLYINGDTDTRIVIGRMVKRWRGTRIVPANTGREGHRLALSEDPALILLDDQLPDLSSHDLLVRLRASTPTETTPVVVLSSDEGQRIPFTRSGATAWFTKPLHIAEVERTTLGLLGLARRAERSAAL